MFDTSGTEGTIKWQDNWVSFLDTMLQFSLVGAKHRGLCLPTRIRKITIDPVILKKDLKQENDIRTAPVSIIHAVYEFTLRLYVFYKKHSWSFIITSDVQYLQCKTIVCKLF